MKGKHTSGFKMQLAWILIHTQNENLSVFSDDSWKKIAIACDRLENPPSTYIEYF